VVAEREGIRTLRVELPTAASKLATALANGDLSRRIAANGPQGSTPNVVFVFLADSNAGYWVTCRAIGAGAFTR
jgi:hypothetical protein